MTDDPTRLRLLASAIAGRTLRITMAAEGERAHTDGTAIFVEPGASFEDQRRQVLVQAALIGAGSVEAETLRTLRGRAKLARRYLALEGRRALGDLGASVPALARLSALCGEAQTTSAADSLARAQRRAAFPEPPEWFGQIRPSRLLAKPEVGSAAPTDADLKLRFDLPEEQAEPGDGDEGAGEESKLLKLLDSGGKPNKLLTSFLTSLLGMSRQRTEGTGTGGGLPAPSAFQATDKVGPHARPLPVSIHVGTDDRPGPASGIAGALYPEWDEHKGQYRPEWCRVLEFPLGPAPDPGEGYRRDEVLRRRLARLGLGPLVQRGRPQGDDVDVDALIDFTVDLRSGHTPKEHIYLERRNLRRDLGVLVLLDASGSATEIDPEGRSVHEHQREAAATLVATLEELGDRVALYAFRSEGRSAVSLLPLKRFSARFGNSGKGWLSHLEPSGYTRMGAAIRHGGEVLKHEAGTPSRLLVVLSDGFPYDDGYEGAYAEGDARRALTELREDGVACLCLSIGTSTSLDALDRVFGSAAHAGAPVLSELSPHMDKLFLGSLQELSRPRPRSEGRTAQAGGAKGRRHRSQVT